MKKNLIWLVLGAVIFCIPVYLFGCNSEPRTISVTGECLTTVPRDRTAVTLRVTTLDKSAATSMNMATTQIAEITQYLKTQDVQMQTTEFNSYERTQWNHALQQSENLGIETTIAIEVSADNMDVIERVLSRFAGNDNVYAGDLHMYTSSSAMKPVLEGCLSIATENARERANALAAGDGRRAGKMLAISYGTEPVVQPRPTNFLRSAKLAMAKEVAVTGDAGGSLVAKDTEVSVTVTAVFEIK